MRKFTVTFIETTKETKRVEIQADNLEDAEIKAGELYEHEYQTDGIKGFGSEVIAVDAPEYQIKKGSIVRYKDGYCRVSALFKDSVNLVGIFHGTSLHKRVPLSEVKEAQDEWYEHWTKSETYMSM